MKTTRSHRNLAGALTGSLLILALLACGTPEADVSRPEPVPTAVRKPEFALAIHGGAGVIPKSMEESKRQEYFAALQAALAHGRDLLAGGGASLDVVEQVVRRLEDSPLFNAGKGAVFTNAGTHEMDAAIMDGSTLSCGSVSGLTTVKNPVSLARSVMEETRHVFLMGEGAEEFAEEMGVERVEPEYFFTQRRYDAWQRVREEQKASGGDGEGKYGTVGAVALDQAGNLAAATSTGGLTNKRFGRVGDVPIIGAGTYAKNATCAVSATGFGEQFIRNTVAHDISALMEYREIGAEAAAKAVIDGKLEPGDGGVIVVGHDGEIAMVFSSDGMFRGAADSTGRFEVKIWE